MTQLPPAWVWATFDEVASVAADLVDPADYPDAPHVAPNHIESGTGRLSGVGTVRGDGVTSPKHRFRPDQVLYSKIRPYLAKATLAPYAGLCSADMYPIDSRIEPRYLLHWMLSDDFTGFAAAHQGRSVLPKINQVALRTLPVPVAPRAEQQRIVAAIEEALSLLDAGETALHNTRTRLKRMRDSVLTAAVTGQLVPQDPTDTPADKLLANLGVSATAEVGDLPAVPPSWAWARLGELAEVVGGVTKDAKRQGDVGNVEVPYLRVANVQRGYLDLTAIATIRVPEAKACQLALQPGDVLFNEGGDRDKLGRGWVWDGQIRGCIHQNHVYRARLADGIEPRFVSWWGNTFGRGWFEFHGKQTTNLASINLTTLKSFPVPLPPPEEQVRIVVEVERQLSFIEAAERAVDAGLARSKGLRRSVLKAAFEGRLVEQDPADEPASVLLYRIAAERATVAPRKGAPGGARGKVVAS